MDNSKIAGVVVTYHPAATVEENLRAMVRECGRVLVVDNGSDPEARRAMAAIPGVELLALGENLGLATALNRGAEWAQSEDFKWMVTFDQDSRPQPGMCAGLWARHLQLPLAAVIGPKIEEPEIRISPYRWVRRNPHWPGLFQRAVHDAELEEVTMVITSGSLIQLSVWNEVGRFDEALFIDYVDIDYCLRVIRAGHSVAVAPMAVLEHHLGNRKTLTKLGHDFRPMNHAAFRHYFIARNRVRVWRRHALAMPHWASFDLCFAGYNMFRVLAFEANKWGKLKAAALGTWDGFLGRTGRCPERRLRALDFPIPSRADAQGKSEL
ncbi:MAG TPA: glycosyltransferase family 2 protein [Lacunisphaera sp.]